MHPAPTAEQRMSPAPMTTGTPAGRPKEEAALSLTWPMIWLEWAMAGSLSRSIPRQERISSDQSMVVMSSAPVLDASVKSV